MEYPKLIRDRIPELVRQKEGVEPAVRRLSDDGEFASFLLQKVVEEARELADSRTAAEMEEEIADLYEVVRALIQLKGLSPVSINTVQAKKRDERGGFEERLVMLERPAHR